MNTKVLAGMLFAALALSPALASGAESCCPDAQAVCGEAHTAAGHSGCTMSGHHGQMPDGMPCCGAAPEDLRSAIEMIIQMDPDAPRAPGQSAQQTTTVWFHRAVWVGPKVLMGKYVIEHDLDRQARGEPCTHIYAADDLVTPVATFHCTHIDSATVENDTVVIQTLPDGTRRLVQFQFAGESAAHGALPGR